MSSQHKEQGWLVLAGGWYLCAVLLTLMRHDGSGADPEQMAKDCSFGVKFKCRNSKKHFEQEEKDECRIRNDVHSPSQANASKLFQTNSSSIVALRCIPAQLILAKGK